MQLVSPTSRSGYCPGYLSIFEIHCPPATAGGSDFMDAELKLRIVLEKPTPGVDFGVQKGRGNDYETLHLQRSKTKDLAFEFMSRTEGKSGDNFWADRPGPNRKRSLHRIGRMG